MFLYQTKDIYDESGNGPFKGLVIRTTPNGCKDMVPATVNQKVMFLEEKDNEIKLNAEFTVGEKKADEETEEEG